MRSLPAFLLSVPVALALAVACGGDGTPASQPTNTGVSNACQATSGFSATGDNPYFPLQPGEIRRYQGEEDGEPLDLIITTLDETETVAGVETRVIEENESQGAEVTEVSRNYFAQASDGTVCYFGEAVDIYENGEINSHEGAWRAGENGAVQGIIMPATLTVGQSYDQENAPGVAQDHAETVGITEKATVTAGTYDNVLKVRETTPLDKGAEGFKYYAPGVGLITDGPVQLIAEP